MDAGGHEVPARVKNFTTHEIERSFYYQSTTSKGSASV